MCWTSTRGAVPRVPSHVLCGVLAMLDVAAACGAWCGTEYGSWEAACGKADCSDCAECTEEEAAEGGGLRFSGSWKDGDRDGTWEYYGAEGALEARELWEMGTRVGVEWD